MPALVCVSLRESNFSSKHHSFNEICTEAKWRFYSTPEWELCLRWICKSTIFADFMAYNHLVPFFFNVHNAWMIWTVGDRTSGCGNWFISCVKILGILKDQIDDHWLTLWIFFVMKASLSVCFVSLCWKIMNLWGWHQNFCFSTVI